MIQKLRDFLANTAPGTIPETKNLECLLADCWDEIAPEAGGMTWEKLIGRMENTKWDPPVLTFTIERHGAIFMGSSRAQLQDWTINVDNMDVSFDESRFRQSYPMEPRLNVRPLAQELARLIADHTEDDRLKWYDDGHVKVLIGEILPAGSAVKETLAGRRKRLRGELQRQLADLGWQECGLWQWRATSGSH